MTQIFIYSDESFNYQLCFSPLLGKISFLENILMIMFLIFSILHNSYLCTVFDATLLLTFYACDSLFYKKLIRSK